MPTPHRIDPTYTGRIGRFVSSCCYGENRWQSPAALYSTTTDNSDPLSLSCLEQLRGNPPSLINLRDIDRLLQTITHIAAVFDVNHQWVPFIGVGGKHGNPCGAAVGNTTEQVATKVALGDPLAIFGGAIMTNFAINEAEAHALLTSGGKRVLDSVTAPEFSGTAISMLHRKDGRCRLFCNPALATLSRQSLDTTPMQISVRGGFLTQPNYTFILDMKDSRLEKPDMVSETEADNLLLAWAVGSTSNSNTVTLTSNSMLIGNGVGQQDRVGGCELAIRRAQRSGHDLCESCAYSDSFFPFLDGPTALADAGVTCILATNGSIHDKKVKSFCQQRDIKLLLIPDEYGRGFFGH